MEPNTQRMGVLNWVALLLVGIASQLAAHYANSATGQAGVIFLCIGFLVAAISYFQMRLEERERIEKLEFDELSKAKGETALFASADVDSFTARRAREQFERILVPAFAILLFLFQGGAVYWLWRWLRDVSPPVLSRVTVAMAIYALFALILFLLGKYSAGLSRLDKQRLLRPGASYLMLGAFICSVVALTEAAAWFGFGKLDREVARGISVVLGLAAAETLINLILEIYRPRIKGQAARPLYESRLIGLLGQPVGIITTAAQALDYQFGFKVSETWFYRFLEKALAWLILLQLGVLLLSSTFVIVEPNEQALLERFGRPVAGRTVLGPGLHVKWPWPIDKVYRHNTQAVQSFDVGFVEDADSARERTVLWTRAHNKEEFNLLVASREGGQNDSSRATGQEQAVPVNLITASIPVQYVITNFYEWSYRYSDAGELLEKLASREVVRYLVNVDVDELMSRGRLEASETLRQRIQSSADALQLGAQIMLVGMQDVHPPVKIADAYEAVIGALQERETNILTAQSYVAEKIPLAHAEATNLVTQAESERVSKAASAAANASQFTNQLAAYLSSPSVYSQRAYLDTLGRALGPPRKYVLAVTNTHDVVILDLEDKIRQDLMDVGPPPAKK